MTASVETDIMRALFERVNSLPLDLPVAWPNMDFTPPHDGKWLRVDYNRNNSVRMHIPSDGAHRHMGLFRVTVHWPLGTGLPAINDVAWQVVDHFPCDLRMTYGEASVRITKQPDPSDLMINDQGAMVPVVVNWECLA